VDKLEKAMSKARQEREIRIKSDVSSQKAAPAHHYQPHNLTKVSGDDAVPLAESQLEHHRILAHRLRSPEADVYRILRTQVLQIMNRSNFTTLAITSPQYGDGKTTTALNLAVSIALDLKQTVLLVDLDLRKPSLDQFLGLENMRGLTDHLVDNVPLQDCLARLPFERLTVLPVGRAMDNSSEVLGSPKMAAFAEEVKLRYSDRLIIYDMPPVLAQDDSIAFFPHVEAALLVVRDGVTKTDDLKTCLTRLSNSNVIGTVLNNSTQG
jgi:protein-tyrosine kinase